MTTDPSSVLATSLVGIFNSALLVLIFIPPARYVRWLQREPQRRARGGVAVAGSAAFEAVCGELASTEGMDRWTARGTLQLALMDAGLEASTVSATQLAIVVERLLPRQLQSHGGVNVDALCSRLRDVLAMLPGGEDDDSAEDVFARLAR